MTTAITYLWVFDMQAVMRRTPSPPSSPCLSFSVSLPRPPYPVPSPVPLMGKQGGASPLPVVLPSLLECLANPPSALPLLGCPLGPPPTFYSSLFPFTKDSLFFSLPPLMSLCRLIIFALGLFFFFLLAITRFFLLTFHVAFFPFGRLLLVSRC